MLENGFYVLKGDNFMKFGNDFQTLPLGKIKAGDEVLFYGGQSNVAFKVRFDVNTIGTAARIISRGLVMKFVQVIKLDTNPINSDKLQADLNGLGYFYKNTASTGFALGITEAFVTAPSLTEKYVNALKTSLAQADASAKVFADTIDTYLTYIKEGYESWSL